MARYLVTGGCGFIGSHLVDRLLDDGHEITVLDDLSTGRTDNIPPAVDLVIGDVADSGTVASALAGHDGCFHLAAIASVERSREDWVRTHRVNVGGAVNVMEAARHSGPGGHPIPVVYASSAAIYGDNPAIPLAEDAVAAPLSAYGVDKYGSELHGRVADRIHGVPTTGFRFFNIYGPRQDPASPYSGVISIFANRIRQGQPITVFGDGEQVRDFVYVGDLVQVLAAAMARPTPGAPVYNVCTGAPTSVNRLVTLLGELSGSTPEVKYAPPRDGDIRMSMGDPRRLIAAYGLACDTSLREGLRHLLAWMG